MQGGWGALGGGAWGSAPPQQQPSDDDSPRGPAPPPSQPAFGSSFRANPVAAPTPQPAPASFGSFKPTSGPSTSATSEADLKKREAEVAERERKVAEREAELAKAGVLIKKKNWPICFPMWHHDIPGEIPEKSRRVVREAYFCWWLLVGALLYQVFCATVMLGYNESNKVPSWLLSIIFFVLGTPLSMILWYKRLYAAARDDSTFGYIGFFAFFALHWAWCVFCAIGVQINAASWSFSGFMAGIVAFDASAFAGIIYMVGGGVWGALALYSMWVLKDAWFFFRGQGGIQEVRQKAAQEAALTAFRQGMTSNNANRV